MCLPRAAKKSNHCFHQWRVVLQATKKTSMGLKASLYSSLATKAAKWVFKSDRQCEGGDGAERPRGCSAWEQCQGKELAKQVTEQGAVGRAWKWWHFNLYCFAMQKGIEQEVKYLFPEFVVW